MGLEFEVDKLTNSIENTRTGEVFDTEIAKVLFTEKHPFKKSDWLFDWNKELKDSTKEIFKLTTVNNPSIIQGLISLEDKTDHIFMHLIESSRFNKGDAKMYFGVPGNLVAFACKLSFEKGYDGFVAFDAKTALIEHYKSSLHATHFSGKRMFVETRAAQRLVEQYFKTK
jgi:hypothetical protein